MSSKESIFCVIADGAFILERLALMIAGLSGGCSVVPVTCKIS